VVSNGYTSSVQAHTDLTKLFNFYPTIRSIGQDTKFTVAFFFLYDYGFLNRVLLMGVKFCMAVRPDLGQVFSHFGGIAPGMGEFWASAGAIWRDMLLAEALV